MAFFADTPSAKDRPAFFAAFAARVTDFFDQLLEAQSRSVEVSRMQRLSDEDLQKMGIARQDIVRYVYRDIFFL